MSDIICGEEDIMTSSSTEKVGGTKSAGDPEVRRGYQMVVMMIETPNACTMDAFIKETETVRYTANFTR